MAPLAWPGVAVAAAGTVAAGRAVGVGPRVAVGAGTTIFTSVVVMTWPAGRCNAQRLEYVPGACGAFMFKLTSTDLPISATSTGTLSGAPSLSPLWKTNAESFSHAQLPELVKRHVLTKASPGLNCEPSGTVTSATCASGLHAAAVAAGLGVQLARSAKRPAESRRWRRCPDQLP